MNSTDGVSFGPASVHKYDMTIDGPTQADREASMAAIRRAYTAIGAQLKGEGNFLTYHNLARYIDTVNSVNNVPNSAAFTVSM